VIFPLDFWDICFLTAVISIILLASSQMLSSYLGKKLDILIDKKKLKNAGIAITVFFLITVVVRVVYLIIIP
jgi:hypothetical protein